jgi:hypothetical protein
VQARAGIYLVTVTWPVAPLAEELPMTWSDDFRTRYGTTASATDRQLDAMEQGYVAGAGGFGLPNLGDWRPPVNPTGTQAAAIIANTARRKWAEGMIVLRWANIGTPSGSTVLVSPGLRYDPADGKVIYAAITNSTTLVIATWDPAVGATVRATVTIAAQTAAANAYNLRLRAVGNTVTADITTALTGLGPGVMSSTWNTPVTWTMSAPDEAIWGPTRFGYPTLVSAKASVTYAIREWWVFPNSYIEETTPVEREVFIPGSAPAKVDIQYQWDSAEAGGEAPSFGLGSWRPYRASQTVTSGVSGISSAPTILLDSGIDVVGNGTWGSAAWASNSETGSEGGTVRSKTAGTANKSGWTGAANVTWLVNPTQWVPDEYSDVVWVQVWLKAAFGITAAGVADGTANPWRVRCGTYSEDVFSSTRWSSEFGDDGLWLPSAASAQGLRLWPLGSVPFQPNALNAQNLSIDVQYTTGIATPTAQVWIDAVYLLPARGTFHSPTARTNAAVDTNAYPDFSPNASQRRKVTSDLAAYLAAPQLRFSWERQAAALVGNAIEPPPGRTVFFNRFSDRIPLEPEAVDTGHERTSWRAWTDYRITPRHRLHSTA